MNEPLGRRGASMSTVTISESRIRPIWCVVEIEMLTGVATTMIRMIAKSWLRPFREKPRTAIPFSPMPNKSMYADSVLNKRSIVSYIVLKWRHKPYPAPPLWGLWIEWASLNHFPDILSFSPVHGPVFVVLNHKPLRRRLHLLSILEPSDSCECRGRKQWSTYSVLLRIMLIGWNPSRLNQICSTWGKFGFSNCFWDIKSQVEFKFCLKRVGSHSTIDSEIFLTVLVTTIEKVQLIMICLDLVFLKFQGCTIRIGSFSNREPPAGDFTRASAHLAPFQPITELSAPGRSLSDGRAYLGVVKSNIP
jgi:hypothetical protein